MADLHPLRFTCLSHGAIALTPTTLNSISERRAPKCYVHSGPLLPAGVQTNCTLGDSDKATDRNMTQTELWSPVSPKLAS